MSWAPEIAEIVGRFRYASNATFLARTAGGELVIYKPSAGERPLWDFPPGSLAAREALTFEVSEALGLGVVPTTVLADGPLGAGAIQRYVDADPDFDQVEVVERVDASLWPLAVLDVVCNNADRKAGHLIREADSGQLFGVDHGLTFHPDDKLRTVLWGFAGQRLPASLCAALDRLDAALDHELGDRVDSLIGTESLRALGQRVRALLDDPVHPLPPLDRPAVPWPPV